MYNEDDEKKVMPIRFFLGVLILIIIFVLLLLWLLPMSDINGNSNRIFKTNMEEMKQAAIQYFDMDSLPKNEGETTKVTLGELVEKKYLLKVKDKNGKECDNENSYVSITKKSDDTYEMKTNLKCPDEEDYIITNLGHYSYCTTEICEQQGIGEDTGNGNGNNNGSNNTKLSCSLEVTSGSINDDGVYNSNVTVKFKNESDLDKLESYDITTNKTASYENHKEVVIDKDGAHTVYGYVKNSEGETAKCSIKVVRDTSVEEKPSTNTVPTCTLRVEGQTGKNGWYTTNVTVRLDEMNAANGAKITNYGIGTNVNYDGGKTYSIADDGNYKVYGYVKDSNGKTGTCEVTINKDSTKPTCSLKVLSGSYSENGYYNSDIVIGWNSKNDNLSGIKNYAVGDVSTSANNDSYRITAIGYAVVYGYVEDYAGNNDMCTITVQKVSKLEYQYSKMIPATFGDWGEWSTHEYDVTNPPKFGKYAQIEIEDLGKTTTIDSYQYSRGEPIYKTTQVEAGTVEQTYCVGYDYYRIGSGSSATTYAVKSTDSWVFSGRVYLTSEPTDSLSTQYKFVGLDWTECGEGCTKAPKKIWDKYTRTVYKATSSNTIVDSGNVKTTCNKTTKKEVKLITSVKELASYEQIRTPIYKDTYTYRKRARNTVTEGYTDYKWSINNDASLLNNGYKLTGNTRVVS